MTLYLPARTSRMLKSLATWGLAVGLLVIFYFTQWKTADANSQRIGQSLRNSLEKDILAFDALARLQKEGRLSWFHFFAPSLEPTEFEELSRSAENAGLLDGALAVDWALLYFHFAEVSGDSRWAEKARRLIRKRGFRGPSYYAVPADRAIKGEALTKDEKAEFTKTCRTWPSDWWVANLARMHQMEEQVDPWAVQKRGDKALHELTVAGLLQWALCLVGVLMAWRAVGLLREPVTLKGSSNRLFQLWSPKRLLIVYSAVSLGLLLLGLLLSRSSAFMIGLMTSNSAQAYSWTVGIWVITAPIFSVAPVLVMRRFHSKSWHAFRRALGFTSADFLKGHYWFIGAAGAGLLFLGFLCMDTFLFKFHLSLPPLDGLSRAMGFLGGWELPYTLLWGCVMAPFAEEIVFRGFFFQAIRARWGVIAGMVASSLVFAVIHLYGPLGTLHVFIYGMVFCWVSWRTKSLAVSMILHGCVNFSLVILNYLGCAL